MDGLPPDEESPVASEHRRRPLEKVGLVVFDVGEHVCALPLEYVREIVPMCELAQPPGLPPLLAGLLNLRGELTPVIWTDRLFSLPPIVLKRHTQLIVLRGGAPLALISDRVRHVATMAGSDLSPAPQDSVFNHCLAGVVSGTQGLVHVLHAEHLLLAQESRRIEELQRIAQSRLATLEEVRT